MTTANFAPKQRGRLSLAACENLAAKAILSTHICKHLAISITIGLLFGTIGTANCALSATTAQTIQGTAPYLFLNGIKATDSSSLLSIKIGANEYISDATGNMIDVGTSTPLTTHITLPNTGDTFNSVTTISPADSISRTLDSSVPQSARIDDDGDGPLTLTGNFLGYWFNKRGKMVKVLTDVVDICDGPYTLILSASGTPVLSTPYGVPNTTTYNNATAKYTINPIEKPKICFATLPPASMDPYGLNKFAGDPSVWNTTMGFITQSTNPATYDRNFPSTGANQFYFTLDVGGVNAKTLTWSVVNPNSSSNITATLQTTNAYSVKVTLNGPGITNSSNSLGYMPSLVAAADLPARFEIKGVLGTDVIVSYGFVIKKWFINGGGSWYQQHIGYVDNTDAWCANTINYKVAEIPDFTNAWNPLSGLPQPTDLNMTRAIGPFISEWAPSGNGSPFKGWQQGPYPANPSGVGGFKYRVNILGGQVYYPSNGSGYANVHHGCVSK